eukprot:471944-Prymnesium_polylepis.1
MSGHGRAASRRRSALEWVQMFSGPATTPARVRVRCRVHAAARRALAATTTASLFLWGGSLSEHGCARSGGAREEKHEVDWRKVRSATRTNRRRSKNGRARLRVSGLTPRQKAQKCHSHRVSRAGPASYATHTADRAARGARTQCVRGASCHRPAAGSECDLVAAACLQLREPLLAHAHGAQQDALLVRRRSAAV